MPLRVYDSKLTNERYMLGDDDMSEDFAKRDVEAYQKSEEDERAYKIWFNDAKNVEWDDAADIVATAKSHLDDARKLLSPVNEDGCYESRWSNWSDSYFKDIDGLTTAQQVLHYAQVRVPFDHRKVVEGHKSDFATFESMVAEEFPFLHDLQFKLKENPRSVPETLYFMHDRLVSNIFYWQMRTMFRCQQEIDPDRVIEIGGGYGSLARLWLQNDKIKRYFIVDLPESLFFAEVCLRTEFPGQVGCYDGFDPGSRVLLIPVGRLDEWTKTEAYLAKGSPFDPQVDLVISVGSLQELSDAWVSFYMRWLDRTKARFFYSLNYMGGSVNFLYESRNFWAPLPSKNWTARSIEAGIPLVQMMCSGRSFVETIYERDGMPQGKFTDWSVLRGALFNRRTYLEGLELLRQDFTAFNATRFLQIVFDKNDQKKLPVPKEMMLVANSLAEATKDPEAIRARDVLSNAQKFGSR